MINEPRINRYLQWLTNEFIMYHNDKTLPKDLCKKIDTFYQCLSNSIDWRCLTKEELYRLGFLNWGEDEQSIDSGVWFIPQWLFRTIPEGTQLYDKNGDPFIFHRADASKEIMYGCLTFGVKLNMTEII